MPTRFAVTYALHRSAVDTDLYLAAQLDFSFKVSVTPNYNI